ncbi:MAG: hypothetical protein AUK48_02065 [Oscillatoriales cyanobacterium CG2_30_44_21]|nr:MAG: hypothetical protein AUK48_02065 [Oscillatoriales cyanobacterium CG2_30_44_21]
MENWEFLLQRKGDKSWLPLESPTVEILEGQYRLAARSDLHNLSVSIAIAYRPLADVRREPFQQKIVKKVSHDGLLIVMPYTNFVPGLWQIDCAAAKAEGSRVRVVKFDVIPVSADSFSEWTFNDSEDIADELTEILADGHVNALGMAQSEPVPLKFSSPILDVAEQRSAELVQTMFDEFAIFGTEENEQEEEVATSAMGIEKDVAEYFSDSNAHAASALVSNQPRTLLRLSQTQYLVSADNYLTLIGEAYTSGEIEVNLKDPQTLEIVVTQKLAIAKTSEQTSKGVILFNYNILIPPPSEIQVLIGEVRILPEQDFQQYGEMFIMNQAIAVSYPASRVLPEMIKEAQKYASPSPDELPAISPEPELSPVQSIVRETKPASTLSLPPLPSKNPQVIRETLTSEQSPKPLSLPPLPPLPDRNTNLNPEYAGESELQKIEKEFALLDFTQDLAEQSASDRPIDSDQEPELLYSFEEELPSDYESLLEQQRQQSLGTQGSKLPTFSGSQTGSHNLSNRFLNKLQTLSADAIAAQKASQRTDELLLNQFSPEENDGVTIDPEDLAGTLIDLDHPEQPHRTIAESNSLAELDIELDAELDRLAEPDLILNEYVWEEAIDPNSFPTQGVMSPNSTAFNLSETERTIRNLQESAAPALPEQEEIPIPEIMIPAGELISGTPILITVRLTAIAPKFFVKFWIKDLQTRMIVDGPRWLLDFRVIADSQTIETQTNTTIPLSSIDVAFEAIAIEAQTQRESHKVRVIRAVIPPNLAQESSLENY